MITTFILTALISVGAVTYVSRATQTIRESRRQALEVQATHLCEAGTQALLRSLWRPFKINQNFTDLENRCSGASQQNPLAGINLGIDGVGNYSSAVISEYTPTGDSYTRIVVVRSVGWIDLNGNGQLDSNEPQKTVDVTASFQLARSQVFDYTYFVNNYGWMDGFNANDLIVNGDMRANGNFNFTNGSPTVNGSVYACVNDKLSPPAIGLINNLPVKWSNSTYISTNGNNARVRQGYNSSVHGAKGSSTYENWRDFVFESTGSILNNRIDGAVGADSTGSSGWTRTGQSSNPTTTMLDTSPTDEVIMPDLSDLTYYQSLSSSYLDTKQYYGDGTANPYYNQGAWIQVWNTSLNHGSGGYQTITTNGNVTGSAALIGTSTHPVLVHGPVTFTQDCVIKGYVQGQGTIYTGRNVHIVGSIIYKNPPDFRGTNQTTIDNANEKKDILALAARGSVMMGDPSTFSNPYPLAYMMPPFTHGRYDENGNWIPPFDATQVDSTGFMKYQSVMGNSYLHSISEGVNQIDAVLYTNFVGGGNIGTGGSGVQFNGSIISKDEAMVVWSLPMTMNYDSRIRERSMTKTPLIDLQLPRSPVMLRSTWQDRGFIFRN
ncbi:MAG TPA: hypothetical protein VHE55_14690 [Fimbriimonadaceae bacterium]|nr:hypothetical protein [Fimbriimonadaceae bacterium]